jgi:predicted transcriptional regulator
MEVHFDRQLEEKLARAAAEQGRESESLVIEAVERMLSYEDWFLREVEKGISAADRGEFVEHDEVRKLIDRRFPG